MRAHIAISVLAAGLVACASPAKVHYPEAIYTQPQYNYAPQPIPIGHDTGVAGQGAFQPNANLFVCHNFSISNRPSTTGSGRILTYSPLVVVNGIPLASAPVNDACLTSGFGPRAGRQHKGIDLQSRPAGPVFSAAPGIVREVSVQRGFGNQVLIDHGRGVFTRYAHLKNFAPGIKPGARIGFGVALGEMGATGNATAIHLHYEILTGNYNTPKKSYGMTANNPFVFPAWEGLNAVS